MINRDTIWAESCNHRIVQIGDDFLSRIAVLTAIHHYQNGPISQLSLCADLSISTRSGDAKAKVTTEATLTADQFDELAKICNEAADRIRHLEQLLAEDAAEIEAAKRKSIEQAKEAA